MQTISPVHLLCYLASILVLWGRQNNGSPTQVSKSWNLSLCYLTWQMDFADEIKWRIWDREILLDYAGGPNVLISESEAGGSQTERDVTRSSGQSDAIARGGGIQAKACRRPPETGRDKETGFPQKKCRPAGTLMYSLLRCIADFWTPGLWDD